MEAPTQIETIAQPLTDDQRGWIDDAARHIDDDWMRDLLVRLVEIPSPWGDERAIAEFLAETMAGLGLDAEVQEIDDRSANAIGHWRGGDGPSLMIFAPLDSPFTGRAEDEVPWVGDSLPDHMKARAIVSEDGVIGLSADNPKRYLPVEVVTFPPSAVEAALDSRPLQMHGARFGIVGVRVASFILAGLLGLEHHCAPFFASPRASDVGRFGCLPKDHS